MGRLFYAMKLVSGTPWKQRRSRKNLAKRISTSDEGQRCDGDLPHSKGIIHRGPPNRKRHAGPFGRSTRHGLGVWRSASLTPNRSGCVGRQAFMSPGNGPHDKNRSTTSEHLSTRCDVISNRCRTSAPLGKECYGMFDVPQLRTSLCRMTRTSALSRSRRRRWLTRRRIVTKPSPHSKTAISREYRPPRRKALRYSACSRVAGDGQGKPRLTRVFSRVLFKPQRTHSNFWPENRSQRTMSPRSDWRYGSIAFEKR